MQLSDFNFDLPSEQIAQYPTPERTGSRLLSVAVDHYNHGQFTDVCGLVQPGDLLVVNNTRVLKARLHARKDSGGQAEMLLERLLDTHNALFQVRVSKALQEGRNLHVGDDVLTCQGRQGQFYHLKSEQPLLDVLERHGHVPLPPYIDRNDDADFDAERYQTVFGHLPGAVAAPTAGLHFSEDLLASLSKQGVDVVEVTLHVGAGTFAPIRGGLEAHVMHSEYYAVSDEAARRINQTKQAGGRIIAVGTTVVRTLESVAANHAGEIVADEGETRLFIQPGYQFKVVDALITNFHLPESTLLMLVCAFAGYNRVMGAYAEAVKLGYRFFSYGDAMWLERCDCGEIDV